jgi:hypothetical protein
MAILSDLARKGLEKNPNVKKITAINIAYTSRFKLRALKLFLNGESPNKIFLDAGIDLGLFGATYSKRCLARWKKLFDKHGEQGLKKEYRGAGALSRKKHRVFKSPDEELAYLKEENAFLKKLHALAEKYEKKKNSR